MEEDIFVWSWGGLEEKIGMLDWCVEGETGSLWWCGIGMGDVKMKWKCLLCLEVDLMGGYV